MKSNIKKNIKKTEKSHIKNVSESEKYKNELLGINKDQNKYDALFEIKLREQYNEFRNLKEHTNQLKKFMRVMVVIIVLILLTLLLLSFK